MKISQIKYSFAEAQAVAVEVSFHQFGQLCLQLDDGVLVLFHLAQRVLEFLVESLLLGALPLCLELDVVIV